MRTAVRFAIAGLMVAGIFSAAPAAMAKGGDVIRRGTCTGSSASKIKLSKEDGRIEVQFEVDENKAGDTWKVKLRHNGDVFFTGNRTTQAPSGSFEVRKLVNDAAGTDTVRARARNLSTDEVCTATASI
ncbi:MAG TPA: hypothetical protein VGJ67_03250 [Actinomycetota bacterium]|jgi:hypothetical protein